MSQRRTKYISKAPPTWEQDIQQLENTKLYLVSTLGPTVYILRTDDHLTNITFKVVIGSSQMCSCGNGEGRGSLCVHILFVMLKVFRVPSDNPLAWQLSLIDSEIDLLLSEEEDAKDGLTWKWRKIGINGGGSEGSRTGSHSNPRHTNFLRKGSGTTLWEVRRKNKLVKNGHGEEESEEDGERDEGSGDRIPPPRRKKISQDPTCPICMQDMTQEEELDGLLCFCAKRCGSNIHTRCLRMYATYNRSENKNVVCPLCRSPWGKIPLEPQPKGDNDDYQMDPSTGISLTSKKRDTVALIKLRCCGCHLHIRSKVFRCAQCHDTSSRPYDLCRQCFHQGLSSQWLASDHKSHIFMEAQVAESHCRPSSFTTTNTTRPSQRWKAAISEDYSYSQRSRIMSQLQERDIHDTDYNTLLSLDHCHGSNPPAHAHLIHALPSKTIAEMKTKDKDFVKPCVLCSCPLSKDHGIKQFPCSKQHVAHESCVIALLIEAESGRQGGACAFCPCCRETSEENSWLFPSLMRRQAVRFKSNNPTPSSCHNKALKSQPQSIPFHRNLIGNDTFDGKILGVVGVNTTFVRNGNKDVSVAVRSAKPLPSTHSYSKHSFNETARKCNRMSGCQTTNASPKCKDDIGNVSSSTSQYSPTLIIEGGKR
mmetsp:Transcript_14807/g.21172  ORF Transcript_14807/g.21172 Transcript_14807/m.21172 type:complete len:649 (-) Transcript_14807:89-2035(-)|eukprot:CAMPEP_0184863880 /NCGR_PEP_ID=MMETSP0580-20130426/12947_1 /TAXON_ID=1118495 /ORGANISM="Dactyliosolen fragilissimus" /LENGTH=648 /DNA_ID=CAMNT_0027362461 /DNA_START=274 /DNA_END=2220 /DNA_ORIENTATION=-